MFPGGIQPGRAATTLNEAFYDILDKFVSGDDDFSSCHFFRRLSCNIIEIELSSLTLLRLSDNVRSSNELCSIAHETTTKLTRPSELQKIRFITVNASGKPSISVFRRTFGRILRKCSSEWFRESFER